MAEKLNIDIENQDEIIAALKQIIGICPDVDTAKKCALRAVDALEMLCTEYVTLEKERDELRAAVEQALEQVRTLKAEL